MKTDRWIALGVAGGVALSRLPFVSRELATWDSVLLARALDLGFYAGADLADQRPQPPGYIFYVGTAALLRAVFGSANTALVAVSVIAAGLTGAVIYLFARRFATRRGSVVATALYATGPLSWSYGEVAMPYTTLGLLSLLLAALFWDARHRTFTARLVSSIAYGIASGFRQDLVLLLAPLWLWMLWPWRREWVPAAIAAAVAALTWLVPSALSSGGLATYLHDVDVQSGRAATFSVWVRGPAAFVDNTAMLGYSLGWALAAAVPLLLVLGIARLSVHRGPGTRGRFFILWIVPALLFYAAVHIGVTGYVLSIVPALAILGGLLFDAVSGSATPRGRRVVIGAFGTAIVLNACVFIFAGAPYSAAAISEHDRSLRDRVALIRERYPVDTTVILAQFEYVFLAQYLPEYRALFIGPAPEALSATTPEVTVAPDAATVLLFGRVPALSAGNSRTELAPGLAVLSGAAVRAAEIRMR